MLHFQKESEATVLFIEQTHIRGFLGFIGSFQDIQIVKYCLVLLLFSFPC